MIDSIWQQMSSDMGGPPLPDGTGPNVSPEYGGDARIDFYAMHLGDVVYRDGPNEIPADAAAATAPAPPFTNADGSPRNASSAFMLLNVDTLESDEDTFKLDLIHEFFHALQMAHNYRATQQGTVEHWFVEASATWAETYYQHADSWQPHGWFTNFQENGLGLQSADLDHQYASYVWPFFMEQDKNAQAIFNAWKATDPIASRDFAAVTAAVGAQLAFDAHFRDFAVRNLNVNAVLLGARVKRYDDLDANFYDDVPPVNIAGAMISPGSPYVSPEQSIPDLAARYFEPEFSQDARKVTISIAQLGPVEQVDGDFLAHYADGSWTRIPVQGGVLQFCRDDAGWDIKDGFLVVSNHGVQGPLTGHVEISAKKQCSGDVTLHGRFTGHTDDPASTSDATFDVTVVWHRPNDIQDRLNFQFESGTYTFDTTVSGVCGGTRSEGGPLALWGDDEQGLILGDPQDRSHEVHATLIDNRLNQGGLEFALVATFPIVSGGRRMPAAVQRAGLRGHVPGGVPAGDPGHAEDGRGVHERWHDLEGPPGRAIGDQVGRVSPPLAECPGLGSALQADRVGGDRLGRTGNVVDGRAPEVVRHRVQIAAVAGSGGHQACLRGRPADPDAAADHVLVRGAGHFGRLSDSCRDRVGRALDIVQMLALGTDGVDAVAPGPVDEVIGSGLPAVVTHRPGVTAVRRIGGAQPAVLGGDGAAARRDAPAARPASHGSRALGRWLVRRRGPDVFELRVLDADGVGTERAVRRAEAGGQEAVIRVRVGVRVVVRAIEGLPRLRRPAECLAAAADEMPAGVAATGLRLGKPVLVVRGEFDGVADAAGLAEDDVVLVRVDRDTRKGWGWHGEQEQGADGGSRGKGVSHLRTVSPRWEIYSGHASSGAG